MTHVRPYRSAMTLERAEAELRSSAGTQFDPKIVDALLTEIRTRFPSSTADASTSVDR
jgi:HD-GYP domain-containing protein (c-di-GMP phosphodiesterase class II)